MKQGKTLQQLAVELDRQNNAKRDFIADTSRLKLAENGFVITTERENLEYKPTDLFHRQLGSSLQIPAKYYDKMRSDYPELLIHNVNSWFEKTPNRHTIRTLDGSARAFLSDRYRRIDNYEVASAVLPIIQEMDGAVVESCEITDTKMYLKVTNPRLEKEVVPGDIVQAGIVISNSEVGLGSVSVMPLVLRLVCSNGMVVNDMGKRKYHIGRENEENYDIYRDETVAADDTALLMKLGDIVRTAVDETKFNMIIDKIRESVGVGFSAKPPEIVELTAKRYGFNENEKSDVLQHLISGGEYSLWGLGNAVTRSAHDVESYDRSVAMENLGWQIITDASFAKEVIAV